MSSSGHDDDDGARVSDTYGAYANVHFVERADRRGDCWEVAAAGPGTDHVDVLELHVVRRSRAGVAREAPSTYGGLHPIRWVDSGDVDGLLVLVETDRTNELQRTR